MHKFISITLKEFKYHNHRSLRQDQHPPPPFHPLTPKYLDARNFERLKLIIVMHIQYQAEFRDIFVT